jgi:hypothetical protein
MIAAACGKVNDTFNSIFYATYSKLIASKESCLLADRLPSTVDAVKHHAICVHARAVVCGSLTQTMFLATE